MNNKIIEMLKGELESWEELLAQLSPEQIHQPNVYGYMSVKDVMAHLYSWQQISIARLEAGIEGREPRFPNWFAGEPTSDQERDRINQFIYHEFQTKSWEGILPMWKEGFEQCIRLAEKIPPEILNDTQKYPWLDGYSLYDVLERSYIHHHEDHFLPLVDFFNPDK